jgi:hypothetical protein
MLKVIIRNVVCQGFCLPTNEGIEQAYKCKDV